MNKNCYAVKSANLTINNLPIQHWVIRNEKVLGVVQDSEGDFLALEPTEPIAIGEAAELRDYLENLKAVRHV